MRTIGNLSSTELILKILANNVHAASEIDDFHRTPLHYAIGKKLSLDVITALLQASPTAAMMADKNKQLPLHIAVKRQASLELVRMLYDQCQEAISCKDEYGLTPLHHAIEVEDSLPCVELLLSLDSRCASDRFVDQIPLHLAIELKRFDLVSLLLNAYPEAANDISSPTECCRLPVQAAIHARAPFALIMAIFNATNRNICAHHYDENGMLTVHYAIKYHEPVELVALLIELDPEVVYIHDLPIYFDSVDQPAFRKRQLTSATTRARSKSTSQTSDNGNVVVRERSRSPSRPSTATAALAAANAAANAAAAPALALSSSPRFLSRASSSRNLAATGLSSKNSPAQLIKTNSARAMSMSASMSSIKLDFRDGSENSKLLADEWEQEKVDADLPDATVDADIDENSHYLESNLMLHKKVKLVRSKTLLHYAIEICQSNDHVIAEILKHTMPIAINKKQTKSGDCSGPLLSLNPRHNYSWSYILSETEDKYWEAVEMVLTLYDRLQFKSRFHNNSNHHHYGHHGHGYMHSNSNVDIIRRLGESPDEIGRKAIDIATPNCQQALLRRLYFHVRYELFTHFVHQSSQSLVQFAYDHHDSKRVVALKFMKNRVHFDREVHIRANYSVDDTYVIPLLRNHDGDADPKFHEELIRYHHQQDHYKYIDYPYVLVMAAAERPLVDAMLHEDFCGGRDWDQIREIAQQLCEDVKHLHDRGLIHGDIRRELLSVLCFWSICIRSDVVIAVFCSTECGPRG
jgi:hypothetical protein